MSCETYFVEQLHQRGLRVTPQRMTVLTALHGLEHFISAEELLSYVQAIQPELDRSTVYRTLDLLVEVQLVSVLESKDHVRRYKLTNSQALHHHLECIRCKRVITLPDNAVKSLRTFMKESYGFVVWPEALTFHGLCAECAGAETLSQPNSLKI